MLTTVILVIHLLIAIALVGVILLQKSEGGALGMGGSGGGMGGFMTARGTANLLTRTTGILAAAFMGASLVLAIIANNSTERRSIMEEPAIPAAPAEPTVPLAK